MIITKKILQILLGIGVLTAVLISIYSSTIMHGNNLTNFDITNTAKSPIFLSTHGCPDGFASHTVQYPSLKNMSWINSCSNQGVWIKTTLMEVDKMIPVDSMIYHPVGQIGIINHNEYGQFIEDFNSDHILNLEPALNITDGHLIKILAYQHYQPQSCLPYIIILSNNTIIHEQKLVQKIIVNQTAYGLTPMDYELTSNEQEACSTYGTYTIQDLNATKYPFTMGYTKDG